MRPIPTRGVQPPAVVCGLQAGAAGEPRARRLGPQRGQVQRLQFGGGLQQRLAIARALLHDPAVLLLDEPFTGLDETSSQILDRIIHEAAAGGKMVLLATHDLERACSAGTRMDLLHSGRIAHSESTSTLTPESLSRLLHEISNKPLAPEQNRGAA